jgi:hypothetical protein
MTKKTRKKGHFRGVFRDEEFLHLFWPNTSWILRLGKRAVKTALKRPETLFLALFDPAKKGQKRPLKTPYNNHSGKMLLLSFSKGPGTLENKKNVIFHYFSLFWLDQKKHKIIKKYKIKNPKYFSRMIN